MRLQDRRELQILLEFSEEVPRLARMNVEQEYWDWVDDCVDDPYLGGVTLSTECEWRGNVFSFTILTLRPDDELRIILDRFGSRLQEKGHAVTIRLTKAV